MKHFGTGIVLVRAIFIGAWGMVAKKTKRYNNGKMAFRSFMKGEKPARNNKVVEAYTSDGERISQATIERRYGEAKAAKWGGSFCNGLCEACGQPGNDPDHTVAKARCKLLHKAELIYDPDNFPWSCRKCHGQWESYKSGLYLFHANVVPRMQYLYDHDPEGFVTRMETEHADPRARQRLLMVMKQIKA